MLIAGPNVAALFPMWLLGLASYRFCVSRPLGKWAGMTLWSFSLVGLILVVFPSRDRNPLFGNISLTPERLHDLPHFYLVALLFAANVVGFRGASPLVASLLNWATKPIRWMGQRTFAIYLFHVPIMQFVVAAAPWPVTSWITRSMIFLGVPLVVFGLAEITERRKDAWRRGFAALLGWASEAKPAAWAHPSNRIGNDQGAYEACGCCRGGTTGFGQIVRSRSGQAFAMLLIFPL